MATGSILDALSEGVKPASKVVSRPKIKPKR
jgi:hypothetical protein